MDIFSPLIEIGKMIYTPISKCVKYHRGLDESMEILQEKLEDLNARKTDIESQISVERRFDKNPKMEVVRWLEKVQKINDDKELEREVAKGKFLSRSHLGRRAAAKIREVEALHQEGSFSDGLMIDAIPSRGEMIPTTTTLVGKATSKKVEEIWNSLINNDVLKIGVWGMGGSGKTTIMKLIRNRVFEQTDRFDNVYWITVSKETSVRKLQEGIASALKIKDFEEIKEGVDRAAKLSAKFKEEKMYVLIFDDVWEAFNLEDIGIPEPTIGNGCKLILTTRTLDVCRRMDCMPSKMELLSEDEAWKLFLEKVGRDVIMTSGLEKIAKQVAKECACLPLAIVAIGTSMKGVADEHRWRNALKELRECTKGFRDMNDKVIEQLKYSYTQLNDEQAQRGLLYCALYPEDYEIERNELVACLIAEEIIEGMESRKDAFDKGHTVLDKLENACLLESATELDRGVKMHDVVRDMALQIRGRESLVDCGVQVVEFPEAERWKDNLETVSLMDTNIKEIHVEVSPRCSKLKTLRLSKSKMLKSIPDSFFLHMPSLCILDLSYTSIGILPNSISELENLTALVLRESGVSYVPSLAKLQRLRVLDLCRTHNIEQMPEGMEMLVNLQYLNINEIGIYVSYYIQDQWAHGEDVDGIETYVYEFPIGILPKLTQLQFFSALGNDDLEIKGEELMGLKKLETLGCRMSVNDFYSYHRSLPICYDVRVGSSRDTKYLEEDESKNFKILRLSSFKVEEEGERSIVVLPNNLKEVSIHNFNHVGEGSSRLPFVEGELWFNVEVLVFEYLSSLRVLVDDIDRSQLQLMSHGSSNGTTFSCLRELFLYRCDKLKHLFKLELVPYFPNLESIDVGSCYEMEELVGVEESDDVSIVNDALTITFPKLRSLKLTWLLKLKSIIGSGTKGIMVCDSIEEIRIEYCPKLKRLPLYLPLPLPMLQHNGQPSPPAALKVIEVHQIWWDSLEWDNPIAKDVLQPFVKYAHYPFLRQVCPSPLPSLSIIAEQPRPPVVFF